MKKKFYEQVPCMACKETGKVEPLKIEAKNYSSMESAAEQIFVAAAQGICMGCFGRGSITVLSREESKFF